MLRLSSSSTSTKTTMMTTSTMRVVRVFISSLLLLLLSPQQVHVVQADKVKVGEESMGQVSFDVPPSFDDIVYMAHIIDDSTRGGEIDLKDLTWVTVPQDKEETVAKPAGAVLDVVVFRVPNKSDDEDCTKDNDYCMDKWPELVGVGGRTMGKAENPVIFCCTKPGNGHKTCFDRNRLIVKDDNFHGLHAYLPIPKRGKATLSLKDESDSVYVIPEGKGGVYVTLLGNCRPPDSQKVHVEGVLGWLEEVEEETVDGEITDVNGGDSSSSSVSSEGDWTAPKVVDDKNFDPERFNNLYHGFPLWQWAIGLAGIVFLCLLMTLCIVCCGFCFYYQTNNKYYHNFHAKKSHHEGKERGSITELQDMERMKISSA